VNIRKTTLYTLILLAAGLWYLICLIQSLNGNLYITVGNYIFFACVILIGQARYKRFVNPIVSLAPLMLGFVYYTLMISNRQDPLGSMVEISYYLFVLAFVVGCIIPIPLKTSRTVESSSYHLRVSNFLLLAAFVVMVVEAIISGGFPIFNMIVYHVDSYASMRLIPVAHYFVLLTGLLPALYYSSYKARLISHRQFILYLLLVAIILFNSLSRQIMIFGLIAFYFAYAKHNKVNEVRLVSIFVVLTTILFLTVGELRIGTINSSISSLEYLKAVSDVPLTSLVNSFDVTFNLYSSMNLNTFNIIASEESSFYFGAYTFRPLLDITQINNIFGIGIPTSRDTFMRLATIIADPYLDFGLPGVFIFGLSYGLFGSYAFFTYTARMNVAHTLLWATFVYVMIMSVFANFFNIFFIWLCLGLCWLLFGRLERK
jgi:oligosaccharide repeat unit polymerase